LANAGTWSGSPTSFSYQWERCDATGANCIAITTATSPQYVLTPDDIGATISLLVTANGKGGQTSAATSVTPQIAAAAIPTAVQASAIAQAGAAGAVVTTDGRATVTWQPGAIPALLTVDLAPFTGTLSIAGSEVALGVDGLPPGGFPWPVDVGYATPQPASTVLGYSTDSVIYAAVPALTTPALPAKDAIGSYVAQDGTLHVLTRQPVRLALFQQGAWGDPSLSSVKGPQLVQHTPVKVLRRGDGSVLVLTSLSCASQVRAYGSILAPGNGRIALYGNGSSLGHTALEPGTSPKIAQTELDRPGGIAVRFRVNGRVLKAGRSYTLNVIAVDPWGRTASLQVPFTAR
ncbi:MAG: hypothetical protein JO073_14145, partial [Actinobacteria bacterium]|nr:hypothetical protein [Actinomycetota bacterium]